MHQEHLNCQVLALQFDRVVQEFVPTLAALFSTRFSCKQQERVLAKDLDHGSFVLKRCGAALPAKRGLYCLQVAGS